MKRFGEAAAFLTADGGRTWRRFATEPYVTTFLDPTQALTVDLGQAMRFGISGDGGRTWQTCPQPVALTGLNLRIRPDGAILEGPFFLDSANGWWSGIQAGSSRHALWRTADGGRTWSDLVPAGLPGQDVPLPQPVFVDALRGALAVVAAGSNPWSSLLATRDGGSSWTPVTLAWPQLSAPPGPGSIVQPALWAHGNRLILSLDMALGSPGPSQKFEHRLSVSEDGGLTWGPWAPMPPTNTPTTGMVFNDAGALLLADGRRLWSSSDLGQTWHSRPLPSMAGNLSAMISARARVLFLITVSTASSSPTVRLMRSLNGGDHWTEIPLPAATA